LDGAHSSGMIAAGADEDIHIVRRPRPARPAADAVGAGQDKGNLLLAKDSDDLLEVDGNRRHGPPHLAPLRAEESAFPDRVPMRELAASIFLRCPLGFGDEPLIFSRLPAPLLLRHRRRSVSHHSFFPRLPNEVPRHLTIEQAYFRRLPSTSGFTHAGSFSPVKPA